MAYPLRVHRPSKHVHIRAQTLLRPYEIKTLIIVGLRHASTGRKCFVFALVFGEFVAFTARASSEAGDTGVNDRQVYCQSRVLTEPQRDRASPLQWITTISPTNRNLSVFVIASKAKNPVGTETLLSSILISLRFFARFTPSE